MRVNAIVGQSGGPTAAINATLAGVIRGAFQSAEIDKIYGMINGMQGFINGNMILLNGIFQNEKKENLTLLRNTPAAALGSCRLKLPDAASDEKKDIGIYEKIFGLLAEKNIKYLFYIGGNDSMDTVKKLSSYAEKKGADVKIVGVPKTIDNDLSCTDHAPGYGSAAKYIAATMQEICHDNAIYPLKSVVIVEIMGRDAGWLTAASALPRLYGGKSPDLLYLPEVEFSDEKFLTDIERKFETRRDIVISVSEGIKYADGRYVCETGVNHETDIFGHKKLTGAADRLMYIVKERFNCKVRAIELNVPQRCASHIASLCDLTESEEIGIKAVEAAVGGKSGIMMTMKRISSNSHPYKIAVGYENIENIANKIKTVPPEYINGESNNVADECLKYIAPLVIGEPEIIYQNGIPKFFIFQNCKTP